MVEVKYHIQTLRVHYNTIRSINASPQEFLMQNIQPRILFLILSKRLEKPVPFGIVFMNQVIFTYVEKENINIVCLNLKDQIR